MAEAQGRIPAWKRLGLALKNEAQSGVTAPEHTTLQSDLQQQAPYDARDGNHGDGLSSTEPAVNGKPSKLGKRKHQHDAADDDGKTIKKGKQSDVETHIPDAPVPVITETTGAEVQTIDSEPPVERAQPKGDPNYRKKKAKPNKNKRRNHEDAPAELALREKEAKALSPDATAPSKGRRTLLASTEIDEQALAPAITPQRLRGTSKDSSKDVSGSPTAVDRRKSVTFTPDTKRVDGSSGQDLFKKWVAEQKGSSTDTSADHNSTSTPPVTKDTKPSAAKKEKSPEAPPAAVKKPAISEVLTQKSSNQASFLETPAAPAAAGPKPSKSKKKDPSLYTSYLQQYYTDRESWKFNKAKQNDVIDNALNIFRIPDEHTEALLQYVQGLKGAGVVERLRGKCETQLVELEKEEAEDTGMGDSEARQALQDEALKTRLAQEQKRRKVEGDIEALSKHANGNAYIRRLRRARAEALLNALGRASPILPPTNPTAINPLAKNLPPMRDSKKRKRRGSVSSDSSSESSSEESSSSEETSEEEESDSEDESGSDSSASVSDSDEDSGSGSSSSSDSSNDSSSDSEDSETHGSDSDSD